MPSPSAIVTSSPVIATIVKSPGYDIVTTTSPTFNIGASAQLEGERQPPLPRLPPLIVRAHEQLAGLRAER